MRELFIKYNPYKVETEITIDKEKPKRNSALQVQDRRLQEWIEDLPAILFDECGTKEFNLTFHGTILDYEDVVSMAKEAKKKGMSITCTRIPAKEIKDKEQAIAEVFCKIQRGPFEELKRPDVLRAFQLANSSDFEVNVVATMSAGKSTLINAMLRQKLMPAKQEACTATITKIKDVDIEGFRAAAYDKEGNLLEAHHLLTFELMEQMNSNSNVSSIKVEGKLPFVDSEDVSLVLVDTPGPNNSRDPEHKAATYRMLSESSKTVVLYILNATQLAVNDDNDLLNHVAESMRVGGKQSRDRFIFVVNKLDEFKRGEDSVEASIKKVRDYLKDKGIENANIFPASALTALNIRTVLAQSDDDDDDEVYEAKGKVRKFNRSEELHFENYAPLTPSVRAKIGAMLAESKVNRDANEEALIHSGIVPIEAAIRMYVEKYAKTAKIKNIVDTFAKSLESARTFEHTKQEIAENQDKQAEILEKIQNIQEKLENGTEAKKFKEKVEKINYDKEIGKIADGIVKKSQEKISARLALNAEKAKLSLSEAKSLMQDFMKFADNLQTEVQVKLEDVVTNHVRKNAEDLLNQYKKKLDELTSEVKTGDIFINPLQLMEGDILCNTTNLIDQLIEKENVKVDTKWVKNHNKKWYKPWTWFQESGHYEDIFKERKYVEAKKLADRFFAPLQENLYENRNHAVKYAKQQTTEVKVLFSEKFDELDKVLDDKLTELKMYANNKESIEMLVQESQKKLNWLKDIQVQMEAILDI